MLNKNLKFLIVNDLSSMRVIVNKMLKEIGFINIDEAEDDAVALYKLQKSDFDFVISDWHMSKMDGLTMLQNMRAIEMLEDIPILMVAEKVKIINVLEAAKAGANGYLARPFSTITLREKLNIICKNIENYTYSSYTATGVLYSKPKTRPPSSPLSQNRNLSTLQTKDCKYHYPII